MRLISSRSYIINVGRKRTISFLLFVKEFNDLVFYSISLFVFFNKISAAISTYLVILFQFQKWMTNICIGDWGYWAIEGIPKLDFDLIVGISTAATRKHIQWINYLLLLNSIFIESIINSLIFFYCFINKNSVFFFNIFIYQIIKYIL